MAENNIVQSTLFLNSPLTELQYGNPSSGHSSHSVSFNIVNVWICMAPNLLVPQDASVSGQDFSGHTRNRCHSDRPAATNPFPIYFLESMPPFQQYPAYPQKWPVTPEPEETFNDTLTKTLQTQTNVQDLMDKISL